MKPQLLEDIGDSQSLLDGRPDLPPSPVRTVPRQVAPPPLPRSHFGVWRDREVGEAPAETAPIAEKVFNSPPVDVPRIAPIEEIIVPPFEPLVADLLAPVPTRGRVGLWTSAAVMLALVAGGSLWFYKDRKDEATLAMLANKVEVTPVAASVAPIPAPVPAEPDEVPPLVLLEPEKVAEPEPETVAEVEVPIAEADEEPVPVVRKPLKAEAAVRPPRKAVLAKAEPRRVIAKTEQPLEVTPAAAFSKACRALGYHEAQCRKRACVLTKFGLACRG